MTWKRLASHMEAAVLLIDSRGGLKAIQLSVTMKAIIMWYERLLLAYQEIVNRKPG